VYLDESSIHHHYSRHQDSFYDPNDELDLAVKEQHKGSRYCFIGPILDSNIICLDIFLSGKRTGKNETKDYHWIFDSAYFVRWFQLLLDKLTSMGLTNTVIVMDNAKYHQSSLSELHSTVIKSCTLICV